MLGAVQEYSGLSLITSLIHPSIHPIFSIFQNKFRTESLKHMCMHGTNSSSRQKKNVEQGVIKLGG
jgi:fatty acid desaturase